MSSDEDYEEEIVLSGRKRLINDIKGPADLSSDEEYNCKDVAQFSGRKRSLNGSCRIIATRSAPFKPRSEKPLEQATKRMGTGQYWHHGLQKCLIRAFQDISAPMNVLLTFHIVKTPIYSCNCSGEEVDVLWPILCRIDNYSKKIPQVIGVYVGKGDPPSASEYLDEFVKELNYCLENGVHVNGHRIDVRIRCIVCDLPVQAFIKGM